ncbi:hypothetical protein [Pseudoclavibacter helvolus]|uniref:hypothetical protein n=1 Tax=Pseudoclavibacter helvolus TaxID=255205 RepID=UPI0008399486|nr:hypothetical protein [Pseudoclavibacter helvolus]
MTYQPILQPLTSIPDNDRLPLNLHELADKWRALVEKRDEVRDERQQLELFGLTDAETRDGQALKDAIENGTPLPSGTEQQTSVQNKITSLDNQAKAYDEEVRNTGRTLMDLMKSNRDEMAELMRAPIEAALSKYEEAAAEAQRIVNTALTDVAMEAPMLTFLISLDRDSSEVQPSPVMLPPDELSETRKNIKTVEHLMPSLKRGVQRTFDVIGTSGQIIPAEAALAWNMITNPEIDVRLVNAGDMPALQKAVKAGANVLTADKAHDDLRFKTKA